MPAIMNSVSKCGGGGGWWLVVVVGGVVDCVLACVSVGDRWSTPCVTVAVGLLVRALC